MTSTNARLAELSAVGVSVWLDDLDRGRITSGNLAGLIETHSVVGVTTNPSIFDKAISSGADTYAQAVAELAAQGATADQAVRTLTTDDVRAACDIMHPVYVATGGADGRVSIEVDPRLARDTQGTIAQAKELWAEVARPNALIKIPATIEGLPAITEVIGSGISVNVTLIFSVDRHRAVMDAWLAGLELAHSRGIELHTVQSVASFFVSRVDTAVDGLLTALGTPEADSLKGKAAIANARLAWAAYKEVMASDRWGALRVKGAQPQRPLWASTGVKDPAYLDTRYVVELAVKGCVNTMPEATLNAVADHGIIAGDTMSGTATESAEVWTRLAALGIDEATVCHDLEVDGVDKFIKSWGDLLSNVDAALAAKR